MKIQQCIVGESRGILDRPIRLWKLLMIVRWVWWTVMVSIIRHSAQLVSGCNVITVRRTEIWKSSQSITEHLGPDSDQSVVTGVLFHDDFLLWPSDGSVAWKYLFYIYKLSSVLTVLDVMLRKHSSLFYSHHMTCSTDSGHYCLC